MQLLCCGCEYSPNSDNLHVDFTQGALGLGSKLLSKSFFQFANCDIKKNAESQTKSQIVE